MITFIHLDLNDTQTATTVGLIVLMRWSKEWLTCNQYHRHHRYKVCTERCRPSFGRCTLNCEKWGLSSLSNEMVRTEHLTNILFMSPGWARGDDHAESSPVQDPRLVPQQTEGCKRWKIQPGGWPTWRPPHNLVKGYISDVKKGTWEVTQSFLNFVPDQPEIWSEFYTLTEMRDMFGCMSPQPRALDWWPPLFWVSGSVLKPFAVEHLTD